MFKPQVILNPTALVPASYVAFEVARDLARLTGGRLVLLHVAAAPGPEQISYAEAASELQPEGYHRRLRQQMQETFGPLAEGVPVEYLVREGSLEADIGQVAREHHVELIVIGTHTAGLLQRLLLGSTAEHIMRLSPCPVLIAKPPADAGPGF